MSAPAMNMPFSMPMFRNFVPQKVQPWIYVFFAVTFQLSGGLYMGTINQMIGETTLMREDLLMCLYANLAGMAIYFPLLFRMKFRFTNKTLLTAAATGVLCCNAIAPYITSLPLLWTVCFIEGMCKIQGTFECMSNIQLWMTPRRDFTVFFPLLHIIILGSMQLSTIISTVLMYYYHWSYMHWFICGLMVFDLFVITICTKHFRTIKKFPLAGIDWLGALLWSALLLEIAGLFNYGEWLDWWNSPVTWQLALAIIVTFALCLMRMLHIRHPYYEPQMWKYKNLMPVLILITMVEMFLAAEHILEKRFLGEVMHYEEMTEIWLNGYALVGILAGCLFAYWWMHVRRLNYLRLIIAGLVALAGYLACYYFIISMDMHISQLYPATMLRGFAYAVLSATFMVCLEEIMTFQHFFQALSIFNMLHMVMGGVIGAAIYGHGINYYMADNLSRYGNAFDSIALGKSPMTLPSIAEQVSMGITEISIKQIYGWIAYSCLFLILLFLIYDAPVRRDLKQMPSWRKVRNDIANSLMPKNIRKKRP